MSLLLLLRPQILEIYDAVIAFFAAFRKYIFAADRKQLIVFADAKSYNYLINKSYLVLADYRGLRFKVDEIYDEQSY